MFFSKKKAARTGLLVLSNKLGLSPENSEYRSQERLRFQSETTHNNPLPHTAPHALTTRTLLIAIEEVPHAQPHQGDLKTLAFPAR